MNFLSHFYIDQTEENPYIILGLVFPDLVRNAYKEGKIRPERLDPKVFSGEHQMAILRGWNRHLFVDQIFHSSDFFKEETQVLFEMLNPVVKEMQVRASFLAHIALELMLDHCLVVNEKVDIHRLYEMLGRIDLEETALFLKKNTITDTEMYANFHQKFMQSAYLYKYKSLESIGYALQQICKRVWPQAFVDFPSLADKWVHILLDYEKKISRNWESIFEQFPSFDNH